MPKRKKEIASPDAVLLEETATNKRIFTVGNLALTGMTIRKIRRVLPDHGVINPRHPSGFFSLNTIREDIKKNNAIWREDSKRALDNHKGRIFMELQAVKAAAWAKEEQDLNIILRAIKTEADIFEIHKNVRIDGAIGIAALSVEEWQKQNDAKMAEAEKTMELFDNLASGNLEEIKG